MTVLALVPAMMMTITATVVAVALAILWKLKASVDRTTSAATCDTSASVCGTDSAELLPWRECIPWHEYYYIKSNLDGVLSEALHPCMDYATHWVYVPEFELPRISGTAGALHTNNRTYENVGAVQLRGWILVAQRPVGSEDASWRLVAFHEGKTLWYQNATADGVQVSPANVLQITLYLLARVYEDVSTATNTFLLSDSVEPKCMLSMEGRIVRAQSLRMADLLAHCDPEASRARDGRNAGWFQLPICKEQQIKCGCEK